MDQDIAKQKIETVSKTALNVFDRCERKFWLRYGEDLNWPGPASDSSAMREEQMRKGKLFHALIEQAAAGISVEEFVKDSDEQEIKEWWKNFSQFAPVIEEGDLVFTEAQLQMIIDDVLVTARYDQIIVRPDNSVLIVDWKTVNHPQEKFGRLKTDWQTVIYPVVLKHSFNALPGLQGREIGKVDFMYWYAGSPENPVVFELSNADLKDFEEKVAAAVKDILSRSERADYGKTDFTKRCEDCPYAVLCDRVGVDPDGDAEMTDDEFLEEFELFDWSEMTGDDILPIDL